jgi:hypothetical protein
MPIYLGTRLVASGQAVTRCHTHLGSDSTNPWDIDTGTTHALDPDTPGLTACGVLVGRERRGWVRHDPHSLVLVDCKRCLCAKILQ